MELRRRRQASRTAFGIVEPNGEYGGRLVRTITHAGSEWVETDQEPDVLVPVKLEPFITKHKRFKIALGGRGGAKSMGFGNILTAFSKDYREKALCLREMQNTIEDSVHALLAAIIRRRGWDSFEVQANSILLDDEEMFKYRGIARNPDGVKSMYGFKRGWVEEAQVLSHKSLEILTPTLREAGSELWFSLNPGSSADPMSQRFLEPYMKHLLRDKYYEDDLHLIVWMNYDDNPWHRELEDERAFDEQNMSDAGYRHKWLGFYDDEVENALIPAEWFDACIDAHTKLGFSGSGAVIAAYDPSDLGPDDKGFAVRHGPVVLDVVANPSGDVNEGTDWAIQKALDYGADWFTWDGDGMGISLKRQIDQALDGKKVEYKIFRGSESPDEPDSQYVDTTSYRSNTQYKSNKDTFHNKRAQYYVWLRDRMYSTYRAVEHGEYINPDDMISLSSEIKCMEQLRSEVCRLPIKPNASGKIQLLSKVEMAKKPYELPSPNLADALMMSMFKPSRVNRERVKIKFQGWGS